MELVRKLTSSRMSRVGWGLAIVALAGAMALSFVFAWSAVGDQQRGAQARAVGYTTKKPLSDLTAGQVSRPIQGDAYRELLKEVKDHVLNDDRVLRVRIFNLSGTLVFSTDTGDRIGVAQIASPQFRTGSVGGVASVLTEPQTPVTSGLADSKERLYVTFAALRLESQPKAAAVVEVDHRYVAIKAAAYQLWRPVQLIIGVLILVSILMLIASFIAWRAAQRFEVPPQVVAQPAPGFAQGDSTRLQKELEKRLELVEESLRTAEQSVAASEREKRQIAERLVAAHEQLELMTAAAQSPKPVKGGDEAVARRLATLEAERDRMAAEVTRLQAELEEREAAPAGDGGGSAKADKKARARLAELEAALADANARAASLESAARQFEEERKVASSELDRAKDEIASQKASTVSRSKDAASLAEAATQLAKAEERAKHAEELVMKAEARAKQATDDLAKTKELAQKAEERSRKAEERSGHADERLKLTEELRRQIEEAEETARQAEDKARQATEQLEQSTARADEQHARANARIEQLEASGLEVEGRAVQAEQRVAQLEAVTKQAEERMTQLEQGGRQAEQRAAQADARLREIEQDRTKLSVELERVKGLLLAREKELAAKTEREGRAEQTEGRLRAVEEDRARLAGELERALAGASPGTVAGDDGGRAAELAARVEELEAQRRQDVSELQRVHGAAEDPFPQSKEETIATRLSRARGRKAAVDPAEEEQEAGAAVASSGGLSLRERLARAAAARHRASGSGDEAGER